MLRSRRPADWHSDLPTSESRSDVDKRRRVRFRLQSCLRVSVRRIATILVVAAFLGIVQFLYLAISETELLIYFSDTPFHSNTTGSRRVSNISLPPGKVPRIDRSVLEALSHLDGSPDSDLLSSRNFPWPPMVTRIPEPTSIRNAPEPSNADPADFDNQFCGTVSCRFLLPLRLGEQESKARIHFLQLVQLARSLNRTLILPNVGKSRIGLCFRWDFSVYYDIKTLEDSQVQIATMDSFQEWVARRPMRPTAQIVSVTARSVDEYLMLGNVKAFSIDGAQVLVYPDKDPTDLTVARCLPTKLQRLHLESHSPVSIHPSGQFQQAIFGPTILAGISQILDQRSSLRVEDSLLHNRHDPFTENATADVLVVDWDLRQLAFDSSNLSLEYSSKLFDVVRRLSNKLGPYLVIHWRMETVTPAGLPQCAGALVETLVSLLSREDATDIRTVWFASDYPYPISLAPVESTNGASASKSGTFKVVEKEHTEAIRTLRAAFKSGGVLEEWILTGLTEEMERLRADEQDEVENNKLSYGANDEVLSDPGVLGILDKIVAMRAALFVSGARGCGRISSFTRQITEERENALSDPTKGLRNIVERFG